MKYLKTIVSIIYYCLIFFSCLAGVHLAHNEGFVRETIFIVYVATTTYAIIELIFRRISFLKNRIIILRILFLVLCLIASYSLFVTTDEMILKKELNTSLEALDIIDISIKPKGVGYLTNITFRISKEDFIDLAGRLGFQKADLTQFSPRSPEMRNLQYKLSKDENTVLCFEKDEDHTYEYYGTRYLIYDAETMTAYYEYENHKGIN